MTERRAESGDRVFAAYTQSKFSPRFFELGVSANGREGGGGRPESSSSPSSEALTTGAAVPAEQHLYDRLIKDIFRSARTGDALVRGSSDFVNESAGKKKVERSGVFFFFFY